ncbi:uncharacterized protein N7529_011608 [Penicillium soppii]|jgi:hypothetical protein|uniref:uncharacterized protein n=1 Tax=Penicillium soppii TaxID=69789 RepID=UPI002548E77D|nr:uncharacterized protein N7529_011608 [Penicillium soppii]KAJ5852223.1 hypothetical protein N7529_011608 [Penicillium soppii]
MATISNLKAIREVISKNDETRRMVMRLKTKDLDPEDYRKSLYSLGSEIFPNWESDCRIRFLAMK